jgi:hypothetical protein
MPDYRKEQDNTLLDLVKLQQQLDSAEIYEDGDGNKIQTVYLGDIRSITPSGKVYYPFAHNNLEYCPHCNGEGYIKNPNCKHKNFKRTYTKAQNLTMTLKAKYGWYHDWPKSSQLKVDKLRNQTDQWKNDLLCPECAGLGSLEARLDEDFWKQLESELDTIEAYHHGSEGDGCDVMVSRGID